MKMKKGLIFILCFSAILTVLVLAESNSCGECGYKQANGVCLPTDVGECKSCLCHAPPVGEHGSEGSIGAMTGAVTSEDDACWIQFFADGTSCKLINDIFESTGRCLKGECVTKSCDNKVSKLLAEVSGEHSINYDFKEGTDSLDNLAGGLVRQIFYSPIHQNKDGFICPEDRCITKILLGGVEFPPGNIDGVKELMQFYKQEITYPVEPGKEIITEQGTLNLKFPLESLQYIRSRENLKKAKDSIDEEINERLRIKEEEFLARMKTEGIDINNYDFQKNFKVAGRQMSMLEYLGTEKYNAYNDANKEIESIWRVTGVDYTFTLTQKKRVKMTVSIDLTKLCIDKI